MFSKSKVALFAVVIGVSGLAGCSDFEAKSTLETTSSFSLIDKEGREFSLSEGSYKTKVELDKDDGDQIVKIKLKDDDGKERKMKIRVPKDVAVPVNGGDAFIKGADVGQPVDFDFNVVLDVTAYNYGSTSEGCDCHSYQSCSSDGEGGQTCTTEEYCNGSEAIEYHDEKTVAKVRMGIVTPATTERVGEWNGTQTSKERVIDSRGPCI